jgi:hypothetical protein
MRPLTQLVYTGENATHSWLRWLATQPGQAWIENRDGQLVIVHEFEDQWNKGETV